MVLEKTDGLPDDLRIDLIPEIGDARDPRVLHQHVAKKFRDALADENSQDGDGRKGSDAVNLGGKKGVQVNRLVGEGILDQEESGIGSAGIEHAVKNGRDHQRDQPFRQPDHGKAHDPHRQPYLVRLDVTQ